MSQREKVVTAAADGLYATDEHGRFIDQTPEACMARDPELRAAAESGAEPIRIVGQTGSEICQEWYRGSDADANASMLMRRHVTGVVTEDGARISSDDAVALIEAGRVLDMIPPPGAPAHAAHVATGFPLLLQVKTCDLCGRKVLFA